MAAQCAFLADDFGAAGKIITAAEEHATEIGTEVPPLIAILKLDYRLYDKNAQYLGGLLDLIDAPHENTDRAAEFVAQRLAELRGGYVASLAGRQGHRDCSRGMPGGCRRVCGG